MKLTLGKYLLILVYVTTIVMVTFRVSVHPTNYTTHDSDFYLKQAKHIENILSSDNTLDNLSNLKNGFSTWPIGYPFCIGVVSYITQSSSLVSSKIVNLIFLGLIFILLYKWQGEKAWFLTLSFFSYGSMEVISETWSETPFIFLVFLLGYLIARRKKYSSIKLSLAVAGCLIFLFLFRYVGVIYLAIVAIYGIYHFLNKDKPIAYSFLGSAFLASLFILFYLYSNIQSTGYLTGMERIEVGHESLIDFLINLGKGLINEIFIARNYLFNGTPPDWLFIVLTLFQASVIFILIRNRKQIKRPFKLDSFTKTLLTLGSGYLAGIICLKLLIPIDNFDFRILFPFTIPLFVALLSVLINSSQKEYFDRVYKLIVLFMIASFLASVPKKYLLNKVKDALEFHPSETSK